MSEYFLIEAAEVSKFSKLLDGGKCKIEPIRLNETQSILSADVYDHWGAKMDAPLKSDFVSMNAKKISFTRDEILSQRLKAGIEVKNPSLKKK